MGKIINFIKNYWFLLLIVLFIVLYFLNKFLESKAPTSIATPISTSVASYRALLPGSTTEDEVNNLLGFPLSKEDVEGKVVAEYQSTNEFRNHIITYENGVAVLIKEMIISSSEKTASSITNEYGVAPYIYYDQNPTSVFNLYIYPENGIAYLGHEDGTLLEVWYFKPTSIDDFISKWGGGFSKDKTTKTLPY